MSPPQAGGGGTIEIRPCTPERYQDLFDFHEREWEGQVRRIERKNQALHWIIDRNPFRDPERSYLLAYEGGDVVGYWGRLPMGFRHEGQAVTYCFSPEARVGHAFRRRGIARRLMEAVVSPPDLYLSLWHNKPIVSLLTSHGWKWAGSCPSLRKVYRPDRVLRRRVANPLLRGVLRPAHALVTRVRHRSPSAGQGPPVERVDRFGEEMDGFFEGVAREIPLIADRTSATLNWRFVDLPYRRGDFTCYVVRDPAQGTVRGYLVTEVVGVSDEVLMSGRAPRPDEEVRRGRIVDFLVRPGDDDALEALVRAADEEFARADVEDVRVRHTLPAFHPALERYGFREERRPRPHEQLLVLDRREGERPPPAGPQGTWALTYAESNGRMW